LCFDASPVFTIRSDPTRITHGYLVWPRVELANPRTAEWLNYVFFISVFWGLLNLMPVYPLDGGQITREILLRVDPSRGIQRSLWLSIFAAIALAALGLRLDSMLMAMLFGYMAFSNYATLESLRGRGPRW